MMESPEERAAMDTQKKLVRSEVSKLRLYQQMVIGTERILDLVRYECIMLLASWIPGALGLFLRSKLYPWLVGKCGKGVIFGRNVVLRHAHKIEIGNHVVIDDNCVLDAKGENNQGIKIADDVFIGRNTIIYCQNGDIRIGNNTNIGSNCQLFSANLVELEHDILIGAYTYLIGGGHRFERLDVPMIEQGRIARGIRVAHNVWIGAGVKILDGVCIATGAILATGAVVNEDIGELSIAGGIPAKVIKKRVDTESVTV